MTNAAQHEILFKLPVKNRQKKRDEVLAIVRKPASDEGSTDYFPYAVWVADTTEEMDNPSKRRSPSSSVETIMTGLHMFFVGGNAIYALESGLPFNIEELLNCQDDKAILEFIESKMDN